MTNDEVPIGQTRKRGRPKGATKALLFYGTFYLFHLILTFAYHVLVWTQFRQYQFFMLHFPLFH